MIREVDILTTRVLPIGVEKSGSVIAAWAAEGGGRAVCAANVHMVMEAWDRPDFAAVLGSADLTVCDGRPLVWACRFAGVRGARQARGLDLLLEASCLAAKRSLAVGLYGAEPHVSEGVKRRLQALYPSLDVRYCWSPPFRELSSEEDDAVVEAIVAAGVQILFVSLGCPKQERWMLAHRERLGCVALGVGAAFDMLSGNLKVAPRWMQALGLEWVFRLVNEPQRLWRRYAKHNARFVYLVLGEWFRGRRRRGARQPRS